MRRQTIETAAKQNGLAALVAFLKDALADDDKPVAEIEARAKAAGLLGQHQSITDSKRFKAAKKSIGIGSRRGGFGPGGEWLWHLPLPTKSFVLDEPDHLCTEYAGTRITYADGRSDIKLCSTTVERPKSSTVKVRDPGDVLLEWTHELARLDYQRAPHDVPLHRWRQFIDDSTRFVDSSQDCARRAVALGWDAIALFGCRSARPLDYIGSAGLLWRIAGGRLQRLGKDWAMVMYVDGTERTFHRRPSAPDLKLAWELRYPHS